MNFITKATSNYRGTQPLLGKILIGVSGCSAVLAAWNYFHSKSAEHEIEFRKKQLAKPIYKLSPEQMIHPPWNKSNLHQWLYRRVEVTGKPIHRLSAMIRTDRNGAPGFESVVPLVGYQTPEGQDRQGLLLALGFIPYIFRHIADRYRIENVRQQTFVGFVSKMEDLGQKGWFDGNAYQDGRLNFSYADLEDLGKASQLKNRKQAEVAVIQRLHQVGDLNERSGKRYSNDCDFSQEYPWCKTQAGALQSGPTPWEYKNKATTYFVTSLLSFVVGASVF